MHILVTGATGNIGQSAVRVLVERGHQVRALIWTDHRPLTSVFKHSNIELFPGDIRDAKRMDEAVIDQEAIVHLAYIIPPLSNEKPELATSVNLDGTRNILNAALKQSLRPRFLFASTFDLFGHTMHLPPPRRLSDPIQTTDLYTEHKKLGEQWVTESGLKWCIFRFADVPIMGFRPPHPIMYEIPLNQRFEVLHTLDAGLAIANALECEAAWERTWLLGGGEKCQITYEQFLFGMFSVMGLGRLPARAFTTQPYVSDWLDTTDSEALLHYQRHSFADILQEIEKHSRVQRHLIPIVRPLVHRFLLRLSPYLD
ncbi:MAG TPA: NAD(P)-dependent oxidoreductase [Chloroflexia bacterium]|nr:NAD(P)-dependent oxidoreductase [Chloroflexia bacterium]